MHQKSQFVMLENRLSTALMYSMLKTSWLIRSDVSGCSVPASTNALLSVRHINFGIKTEQ